MPFFNVGEARPATDEDFNIFKRLADDNTGWKNEYNKHGTLVWTNKNDLSDFRIFKVATTLKGLPASVLYDVLHDAEYRKSWDANMVEGFEICQIDACNDIGYYSAQPFPPFKRRDFITQRSWRATPQEYMIFNHSVTHASQPVRKECVRAISFCTGYVVRPTDNNESCSLIYLTHSDPRGKIPAWVINTLASMFVPKVIDRVYKASKMYNDWKAKHRPEHKPWLHFEQNKVVRINWNDVNQGQVTSSDPDFNPDELSNMSEAEQEAAANEYTSKHDLATVS